MSADEADVRHYRNLWQGWNAHHACRDCVTRAKCAKMPWAFRAVVVGNGGKRECPYLLSDEIGFVVCLDFEAAVVRPKVDRNADTSEAAFVDLHVSAQVAYPDSKLTYHLSRLRSRDRKLHIGVSLPETVEQRVASKESVVCFSGGRDCLGARVAVQATFLCFGSADEFLPVLELLRIRSLCRSC